MRAVGLTGNDTSGPIAVPDRGAKRGSFAQEEPEAPVNSAKAAKMTPSDPSQLHGVVLKATQGVKGTKAKRARSASPEIGHGTEEPSLQPPRSSNGSAGGSKAAKAEPAAKAAKNGAARERKPAVEVRRPYPHPTSCRPAPLACAAQCLIAAPAPQPRGVGRKPRWNDN